ncbi:MAG: hypothetical protein KatS3mg090_0618 [Patescibacteria group bacterium]|nr:MAG: hypothetical protein KatS3mg090_0618 [Patescibacteria group bacterium]
MIKKIHIILIFLIVLFSIIRIKTIKEKTFPYTYDQGRDFLKVEEVVRYKNPTFIGPTTGLPGVYHGAWWYYFLAIPYILTNGNPIAFPYWLFLSQLLSFLLFFYFLNKNFSSVESIIFLSFIAFSPYFISMSTFVINSVLTFPFILLFVYSIYNLFATNKSKFYFLIFLSVGFVWEAEFAFGIFLLPATIIMLILFGRLKDVFLNKKNLILSALGLIIPLSLRLAFEIKNNFIQTKTFINFIINPKLHNPRPLLDSAIERITQFSNYYTSIFPDFLNSITSIFFLTIITSAFIITLRKKSKNIETKIFYANNLIIFLLFALSVFYRDNFWANYYEGIQLFFIISIILAINIIGKTKTKTGYIIIKTGLILILTTGLISSYNVIKNPSKPQGFFVQDTIVNKIYNENKGKEFCVKIYTPPVIPYTWDYLFKYYSRKLNTPEPKSNFVNNTCYFIIEDEAKGYEFRITEWRQNNIPKNSKVINKEYQYGVTIEFIENKN